jgi:RNA polymerase sigma factor (sigma-70 family)
MQIIDFKLQVLPLSKKLLRFAEQLLKDNDEAKDVVQDVFLKLWQMREELDRIENHEAFAMRMVRNKCLDRFRAKKTISMDENVRQTLHMEASPETDRFEMADTAGRIGLIMQGLPEQQQTIMYMRDIENHEYDEISEVTGLNTNAIRVTLSRARKKVRDELLKTWEYETERDKNTGRQIF